MARKSRRKRTNRRGGSEVTDTLEHTIEHPVRAVESDSFTRIGHKLSLHRHKKETVAGTRAGWFNKHKTSNRTCGDKGKKGCAGGGPSY